MTAAIRTASIGEAVYCEVGAVEISLERFAIPLWAGLLNRYAREGTVSACGGRVESYGITKVLIIRFGIRHQTLVHFVSYPEIRIFW
jgi:hypothetical protein